MLDANFQSFSSQSDYKASNLFGTLEVYSRAVRREEPFTKDEQTRLKAQAGMMQIGLENLSQRMSLIHQVRYLSETYL